MQEINTFLHRLLHFVSGNADIHIHTLTESAAGRCEGRLNKKDGLTRYGNSHVKDKTS